LEEAFVRLRLVYLSADAVALMLRDWVNIESSTADAGFSITSGRVSTGSTCAGVGSGERRRDTLHPKVQCLSVFFAQFVGINEDLRFQHVCPHEFRVGRNDDAAHDFVLKLENLICVKSVMTCGSSSAGAVCGAGSGFVSISRMTCSQS